jgi:hypothetical protein
MLVGDSVTFSPTALGDGIQARLEADLTERLAPRPVEVLAFACPGWGLRDYAIVIQKAVSRFEIDHLVVNFIMNDVPVEPVELDPDLPRRPTGAHPGATPILRSILRHTAVGTWTHWALKGVLARSGGIDPALVTLALPTPFIRARMELTRPVWVALRDFARSRGIGFTVAFLPYAVQIDADLGRRVVEEWYGERFDPRSLERAPQREWLRICEQERIDCIDAAPAFAAAGDVERLYFPTPEGRIDYIHFSPEGNAVAARVVADRLTPTLADRRP